MDVSMWLCISMLYSIYMNKLVVVMKNEDFRIEKLECRDEKVGLGKRYFVGY